MTVELDYDYLKSTVESFVPYFNKLEVDNKSMMMQLKSKTMSAKLGDKSAVKNRRLEIKLTDAKKENERKVFHLD